MLDFLIKAKLKIIDIVEKCFIDSFAIKATKEKNVVLQLSTKYNIVN